MIVRSLMLVLAVFVLAACVVDTPSRPSSPTGTPGTVSASVSDFTDTDANRFRDSARVFVYVFQGAAENPVPMRAKGAFEFRLERRDGTIIHQWRFNAKQTAAALANLPPGPGFVFDLSLIGRDQLSDTEAELVTVFTPDRAQPLAARSRAVILIGSMSRPKS
ncbi:MAG: hypothetical protein ACKVW3_07320 [Phycisphaerales bacterium]